MFKTRILALILMLLAGLSSVWGITPSESKTAPSEIFSQTLQIASDELPQVRQLQRTKPLLLYETASECIVVSNKGKVDFYGGTNGPPIPATGYRAVGGPAIEKAMKGDISSNPTYFTFDDISGMTGPEIKNFLQLKYPPSHYAEFDTLQIIDDISIPHGKWNTADYLEPLTKDFPEFGTGGATQGITTTPITNYLLNNVK